jgi:hypothetical protein
VKPDAVDEQGNKLVVLTPSMDQTIRDRRPLITANLSGLGQVLPESLSLRVSGFGLVPVQFNPETQTASFRVPQPLRIADCSVMLTFTRVGAEKPEVVSWKFNVDQTAAYQPLPPPGTNENAPATASPSPSKPKSKA